MKLVNLAEVDPSIVHDIRYATPRNFLGFSTYSHAVCFLHPEVAEALKCVHRELKEKGFRLKVYDGYRPLPVQVLMWEAIQDERYISNPAKNMGRHTRGTAVDVTLLDSEGQEVEMPTSFDEFSERAHSDFKDVSLKAGHHRELLHTAMSEVGFEPLSTEWWHFDWKGWWNDEKYPAFSISLSEIVNSQTV